MSNVFVTGGSWNIGTLEQGSPMKVACYTFGGKKPPMRYEEVEKAAAEAKAAQEKFVKIETDYLESRGFEIVLNHEKGKIRWRLPSVDRGHTMPRQDALGRARTMEREAKAAAERKIAELKAEHGIGEGE